MSNFVESAQNGILADAVIFTFQPGAFPATLDRSFQPMLLETEYSAASATQTQLYLAPSGVATPENFIMIVNDVVQWASRGCRRVPRTIAPGVPWELRAARAVAVNSYIRFWWVPSA